MNFNKISLFIPQTCKVGFNLRKDTYQGKLGYVIAKDGKKWRKERSWNGWIQLPDQEYEERGYDENNKWFEIKKVYGEELTPIEFENIPTSGFVLNKKVGGYSSGWNARQTYSRVFDPRGFEFEISVQNLLYILEHSNSIRGKGLEGEFVYSWDGKDLVLLPVGAPEYQASLQFKKETSRKIKVKELVPGYTYADKKGQEYVFVGKEDFYQLKDGVRGGQKRLVFLKKEVVHTWESGYIHKTKEKFIPWDSPNLFKTTSTDISGFAELFQKWLQQPQSSDVELFEIVPKPENFDLATHSRIFAKVNDSVWEYHIDLSRLKSGFELHRTFNMQTKTITNSDKLENNSRYYYFHTPTDEGKKVVYSRLHELGTGDLYVTYKNGLKKQIDNLTNI